ncbi:MAG: primosomal protein N' [Methylacidiphilales bacterium]|nr:primosomal protein N' [Candidatus Methylacidiphilales bacterium]
MNPDTSPAKPRYVRVVPELALDRQFDYILPPHLAGAVQPGQRLRVPWGTRTTLAYAVEFPEKPEVAKCREVLDMVDSEPILPPVLIRLAHWMADYYCCEFNQALRGMLPELVRSREDGFKQQFWVEIPDGLQPEVVLAQLKKARAQSRAWQLACDNGGGWLAELSRQCGATPAVWRSLEEKKLVLLRRERRERNPLLEKLERDVPRELNEEQRKALELILEQSNSPKPKPVLLRGVTGSGKTEVYLQALSHVLKQGKGALMLVPEISLTPQTVERFRRRFECDGIGVAVLHSHLSAGERHDQWQAIRQGRARVVIGARSAVFAPLAETGIIIVDEEHEQSYKQEETPHYHARDLAVVRAGLEGIPIVLGSATPSLEAMHNVATGKFLSAVLTRRVENFRLPVIQILDLRKEKPEKGQSVLIAEKLRQSVLERLERGEQSIIFLNRRGYATSLQCPKCGEVSQCPHCSVPLTYHRSTGDLCCHFCDHRARVPAVCPECAFDQYRYSGTGTQKVEDAVVKAFPGARICRMDSDSMQGKRAYHNALMEFRDGRTDILVGTQMIAKGLHFPNVTLVGVVNCDLALQLPDFRAAERVFQQLVQVAGRAGRGDKPGEVFIQTYTPFHPAIQFARHHDVEGFCEQELDYRRAHHYPPWKRAALVCFRGRSEEKTKFCIEAAARRLRGISEIKIEVPEPAPAPIAKIRDYHRFQLFLLESNMPALSRVLKREVLHQAWPDDIRVTVDIDPVNLM